EDPKLTVKSEALRAERIARGLPANPLKVGVVSEANIGSRSEFLHEGGSRVVLFTTSRTAKDQLDLLRSQGADIFVHAGERVDLPQAMNTLAELGVKRLMVEGGAILNFELLRLGLVDEVYAFVAPMIFGGQSAPTLASGAGLERSADAISLNLLNAETWEDGGILLTYSVKRQRG
ncbi:MAG TPA: dihydrofolate reductase family protein, partial [Anaerolineales bacterium]|nr:dihydrofolate reductase family protein [Anaerolineales bacterium]